MPKSRYCLILAAFAGFVLLGPVDSQAQDQEDEQIDGPRIFCEEPQIDLGRVREGDKATAIWVIKNIGTRPLVIDELKASCGCTTVALTDAEKVVAAGATQEIKATFDSKGRNGMQGKRVTIKSNDPANDNFKLEFRADVFTLFDIRPKRLHFRNARRGEAIEQKVEIVPTKGLGDLKEVNINVPEDYVTYKIEDFQDEGTRVNGMQITFTISDQAPIDPVSMTAEITAKVGDDEKQVSLMISGQVVGDLAFRPRQIQQTRPISRGDKLLPVVLSSPAGRPFKVIGAGGGSILDVDFEERREGIEFIINMTVRDDAPSGPFGAMVNIRTTSLDQPMIQVPIYAHVKEEIQTEPPLVLLSTAGETPKRVRRVRLEAEPRQMLDIMEVHTNQTYLSAKVIEAATGDRPNVKWVEVALEGDVDAGIHDGLLTVRTNVNGAQQITMPITVLSGDPLKVSASR
jgi:hypothetical protein